MGCKPNIRFPGQYFDQETGLHYNGHRYYDPGIGRYISADPIGQLGGINLYVYTLNDPINGMDPLGLVGPLWFEVLKRVAKDVVGAKPAGEYEALDSDGDGIPDFQDGLPNTPGCCIGPWEPSGEDPFPDRPPSSFPDSDGDGFPDVIDPTPNTPGWDAAAGSEGSPDDCDPPAEGQTS